MPETTLDAWRSGTTDVVAVNGPLDLAASVQLRLTLYELLDDGSTDIVVDLSAAPMMDASAVGVLLTIQDQLQQRGGSLRIQAASSLAHQTMEITGAAKALAGHHYLDGQPVRENAAVAPADQAAPHGRWGGQIDALVARMHELAEDHPEREKIRQHLIESCLPFAERLARRFHGLGEPIADLNQVAALGLVKAVDRYDAQLGADLARYATSTIIGELKRHFRDRGWSVRVPRRLKDLRLEINHAAAVLTQDLGHSPTAKEVGDYLHVDVERVLEAAVAARGYRASSLDAPSRTGEAATAPVHWLGCEDGRIAAIEDRETLKPLVAALPDRDQRILILRFYGNQTQAQIADQLGISQMHVSRLLTRILDHLREKLLCDE